LNGYEKQCWSTCERVNFVGYPITFHDCYVILSDCLRHVIRVYKLEMGTGSGQSVQVRDGNRKWTVFYLSGKRGSADN